MRFEFTPAAERALAAAAGWTSRADDNALYAREALLGLLDEPECRAALILARHGVDAAAVCRQFPMLVAAEWSANGPEIRFSNEWLECLRTAESLLADYPPPLVFATEHLLLGIVATPGEVSTWLAERGLTSAELEAEVHRLWGHETGPLDVEGIDEVAPSEIYFEIPYGDPSATDEVAAMRIMDAASNRAGEGLRVIEDYLRFALDDRHLTAECKSVRHALVAALSAFPIAERHAARETRADVGTNFTLPSEQSRQGSSDVAAASFKRVEQALRSLEEYSKPRSTVAAGQFEQLRYRVYTLERAVDITMTSLERLAEARLYVLVDACESAGALERMASSLVAAGVSMIQLREKKLPDRELLERARLLADVVQGSPTLFIVNDRPDLAVLAGADGVHVGQDELSVKDARSILGPRGLIGVSTHSLEQARAAVIDGANYIGVGPTFPSTTKQFAEFMGLDLLRAVAAEIRLPAFAIGGITLENLPQVLATGVSRIAVRGVLANCSNVAGVVAQLGAMVASPGKLIDAPSADQERSGVDELADSSSSTSRCISSSVPAL